MSNRPLRGVAKGEGAKLDTDAVTVDENVKAGQAYDTPESKTRDTKETRRTRAQQ